MAAQATDSLAEANPQAPGLVKEELRPILSKMTQIMSKIRKNQGFNFLESGNPKFSRQRPTPAFSPVGFKQERHPKTRINQKNASFKHLEALFTQSQKFQNGFVDGPVPFLEAAHPFLRYFDPLGAKYTKKMSKKYKSMGLNPLWGWLP